MTQLTLNTSPMSDAAIRYSQAYYGALVGFAGALQNSLTILLYHGVTNTGSYGIENYNGKHIGAAQFRAHMQYIRENCNVLSMDEVVDIVRSGSKFPRRAVAVTFDDGFANNHDVAVPILAAEKVPATFYICAGVVDTGLMFWVDELEDCINLSKTSSIRIDLGEGEQVFGLRTDIEKIASLDFIKARCKALSAPEKNRIVAAVRAGTGVTPLASHAENYRKISWDNLREMAADPLFTIGGHSLYHDILESQTHDRQSMDIELCQKLLSYRLEMPITHFSYPEGQLNHFNQHTIDTLKRLNVVASPSAVAGLNVDSFDLFRLKRIMVGFYGLPLPYLDPKLNGTELL